MALISIVAYAINIKDRTSDERYLLNDLEGRSFRSIFKDFVDQNLERYEDNDKLEKIFKFKDCTRSTYTEEGTDLFKYMTGAIKTGTYGQEAEIVNKITGAVEYTKNEDDAEVMPFHFIIAIPTGDTNRGILILQKNGIFGVKTLFENILFNHFKEYNNDYRLALGNVAPAAYLERLLNEGILQKIRFFRYAVPQDRANQVGINNGVNGAYEEYVINKPIGFIARRRERIMECIRGQREITTIVELNDFAYENMKLEFQLGKTHKTINLGDTSGLGFSEDITNQVTLLGGHPTTESIKPILVNTAATYLTEMGLIVRR